MSPRNRGGAGSEWGDGENVFNTENKMFALTFFGWGEMTGRVWGSFSFASAVMRSVAMTRGAMMPPRGAGAL